MINHVFSRYFFSGMVLYTCRILIGSISRVTLYRREYWSYISLPIYWSTVVFFASKYFSKTGQLCEKFNPVAWFTHHALPGPAFTNMV